MDIRKLLTGHQLRVTTSRVQVLELFLKKDHAQSYQELNEGLPGSFDRVTLYRILNQFEENGLIHKVVNAEGNQFYAMCSEACDHEHHADEHCHFFCEQCEKTYCLEHVNIPTITLPVGYESHDYSINITGICKHCRS